ncbi:MAG: PD-(D/E)XK nuclease family protein, partial [Oscillospiraceae bacterium]|nr:PD-(D/E)XK nuclease family protein [Oscillospiraceae bacterium]
SGGRVDRVAVWRAPDGKLYVRAVDYKTGAAEFDYAPVLQGGAVQLPLYLAALTGMPEAEALLGGKTEPAGFLYIPAGAARKRHPGRPSPEERESARRALKKRRGLLLDDPEVLRAMEDGGTPSFDYLPVRLKKDGTPFAGSPVLDAGQMDALGRRVLDDLRRSALDLTRGDVSARPLVSAAGSPCDRCDYRQCCYHDETRDGINPMRKMNREQFLAELEAGVP